MVVIREFRIFLPISVEEYQVGWLYTVAEASKNETGGGDGVEVITNEPFENEELGKGQYTHKIYHLQHKVPSFIRLLAPRGSLEVKEEAWNAYPYCRTEISNPAYMKDNFYLKIETWHKPGREELDNVHNLPSELLKQRTVDVIDIVNDPIDPKNYNKDWDPAVYKSQKTGRGPLKPNWRDTADPVMCCYKLITFHFKWWGIQTRMEKYFLKHERQLFQNLHRQVFCWLDEYYDMTMDDIREMEAKTKEDLNQQRCTKEIKGFVAQE